MCASFFPNVVVLHLIVNVFVFAAFDCLYVMLMFLYYCKWMHVYDFYGSSFSFILFHTYFPFTVIHIFILIFHSSLFILTFISIPISSSFPSPFFLHAWKCRNVWVCVCFFPTQPTVVFDNIVCKWCVSHSMVFVSVNVCESDCI